MTSELERRVAEAITRRNAHLEALIRKHLPHVTHVHVRDDGGMEVMCYQTVLGTVPPVDLAARVPS